MKQFRGDSSNVSALKKVTGDNMFGAGEAVVYINGGKLLPVLLFSKLIKI